MFCGLGSGSRCGGLLGVVSLGGSLQTITGVVFEPSLVVPELLEASGTVPERRRASWNVPGALQEPYEAFKKALCRLPTPPNGLQDLRGVCGKFLGTLQSAYKCLNVCTGAMR